MNVCIMRRIKYWQPQISLITRQKTVGTSEIYSWRVVGMGVGDGASVWVEHQHPHPHPIDEFMTKKDHSLYLEKVSHIYKINKLVNSKKSGYLSLIIIIFFDINHFGENPTNTCKTRKCIDFNYRKK